MIVRDPPSAAALFFVMRGSVVPRIAVNMIAVAGLTLALLLIDRHVVALPSVSHAALGVFGIALSLFLGFRNNAAYDRWWEARRLWGSMIADIRALGRAATIFLDDPADRRALLDEAVIFAHRHRGALRGVDPAPEIDAWASAAGRDGAATGPEHHANPADAALRRIAVTVARLAAEGRLSEFGQITFDRHLAALGAAQAGCERIAATPLPFVYALLVRRTTYLYCLLLPFGLIDTAGWLAPLVAAVVAYVFFGLQVVTTELEHPFQAGSNGLPLRAMCRTIEISVAEALDRTPPPPLRPERHVLD